MDKNSHPHRRRFLKTGVGALAVIGAGCLGDSNEELQNTPDSGNEGTPTDNWKGLPFDGKNHEQFQEAARAMVLPEKIPVGDGASYQFRAPSSIIESTPDEIEIEGWYSLVNRYVPLNSTPWRVAVDAGGSSFRHTVMSKTEEPSATMAELKKDYNSNDTHSGWELMEDGEHPETSAEPFWAIKEDKVIYSNDRKALESMIDTWEGDLGRLHEQDDLVNAAVEHAAGHDYRLFTEPVSKAPVEAIRIDLMSDFVRQRIIGYTIDSTEVYTEDVRSTNFEFSTYFD